jgi:hypothetical protein
MLLTHLYWLIDIRGRFIMRKMTFLLLALLLLVSGCAWIPGGSPQSALLPQIIQFESSPSVINQGEVSYLVWSVTEANSVSIDNGIGNVALSGRMPVSPGVTTFYTLTAQNVVGANIARTQVIVEGTAAEPIIPSATSPSIVSFYADRIVLTPGQHVTLSWEVLGAADVNITPLGKVNTRDSITLQPMVTTTYVLTASNSVGTSTAGITVAVQSSVPTGTVAEKTLVLRPVLSESGSLVRGAGYLDYTRYPDICAGDTSLNLASRAFLSFDISSIPHDAIVDEAILDLSNYTVYGAPTYMKSIWGNMGAIEIYFVQYTNLDYKPYTQDVKLTSKFTDYPLSPWTVDVRDSIDGEPVIQGLVQQGSPRSQFRIQFFTSTNWDSTSDMFCFDNATLTIKYTASQ